MTKGFLIGALWGLLIGGLVLVVSALVLDRRAERAMMPVPDPVSSSAHILDAVPALSGPPVSDLFPFVPSQPDRSLWPRPPSVQMPAHTRILPPPTAMQPPGSDSPAMAPVRLTGADMPTADPLVVSGTTAPNTGLPMRAQRPNALAVYGPAQIAPPKGPTPPPRIVTLPTPLLQIGPIDAPVADHAVTPPTAMDPQRRNYAPKGLPPARPVGELKPSPQTDAPRLTPVNSGKGSKLSVGSLSVAPDAERARIDPDRPTGGHVVMTGAIPAAPNVAAVTLPKQVSLDAPEPLASAANPVASGPKVAFVLMRDQGSADLAVPSWTMTWLAAEDTAQAMTQPDAGQEHILRLADPLPATVAVVPGDAGTLPGSLKFETEGTVSNSEGWVLDLLNAGVRGILGLDRASPDAFLAASQAGLPGKLAYRVLDGQTIPAQLDAVAERARRDGQVIVLVTQSAETFAVIDDWLNTGAGLTVTPVPLSALMP